MACAAFYCGDWRKITPKPENALIHRQFLVLSPSLYWCLVQYFLVAVFGTTTCTFCQLFIFVLVHWSLILYIPYRCLISPFVTSSKAKLSLGKLRNLCQLEVVWIRFQKLLGNSKWFFLLFFNLKYGCAGVSGCASKEIFVLGWRWGLGYLWFSAICSQSILWSLERAYFPCICSALESCTVLLPALLCHAAFPQTAHHQMPIHLCLAVTEDKQELQLLSPPYMLQVTKW